MRISIITILFLFALLFTGTGRSEVLSSSTSGFLVRNEAAVGCDPDSAYNSLVRNIGFWWDPSHTFSGDSRNLSLEATAGGCFREVLPNQGGVRHLEVVFVSPGKTLRMSGALGPLQRSGLAGSMTWSFVESSDSTTVELRYSVGGYYEGDIQKIAPVVDSVLRGQLMRLKAFTEKGDFELHEADSGSGTPAEER